MIPHPLTHRLILGEKTGMGQVSNQGELNRTTIPYEFRTWNHFRPESNETLIGDLDINSDVTILEQLVSVRVERSRIMLTQPKEFKL